MSGSFALLEIPWSLLGDIGLSGMVVAFVVAILTGRLLPVSVVKEVRSDRDLWRETALMREESLKVALESVKETSEAAETILSIVYDLRRQHESRSTSRETNDG